MKELLPTIIGLLLAMVVFTFAWRAGAFLKLSAYWNETMEELRKCAWPSWDELVGSTVLVVVSVLILGAFTFTSDLVINWVITQIV